MDEGLYSLLIVRPAAEGHSRLEASRGRSSHLTGPVLRWHIRSVILQRWQAGEAWADSGGGSAHPGHESSRVNNDEERHLLQMGPRSPTRRLIWEMPVFDLTITAHSRNSMIEFNSRPVNNLGRRPLLTPLNMGSQGEAARALPINRSREFIPRK